MRRVPTARGKQSFQEQMLQKKWYLNMWDRINISIVLRPSSVSRLSSRSMESLPKSSPEPPSYKLQKSEWIRYQQSINMQFVDQTIRTLTHKWQHNNLSFKKICPHISMIQWKQPIKKKSYCYSFMSSATPKVISQVVNQLKYIKNQQ